MMTKPLNPRTKQNSGTRRARKANRSKSIAALISLVAISAIALTAEAKKRSQPEIRTPEQHQADGWNYHFYFPFVSKLAQNPTINVKATGGAEQARCEDFYSEINQKRSIKIIMGLGYYDDSEGKPLVTKYRDDLTGEVLSADFGMNATVDGAYVRMYSNIFTKKCEGPTQVCGFKEVAPGIFQKTVKNPEGKKVEVTLEMKNSSVTNQAVLNTQTYAAQQQAKTKATTRWFFGSIPSADLVIYNGHSRKGGGPDFGPPKLLKNLHVNYSYYAKNEPGLTQLLQALSAPRKPKVLMMMSCNSTTLFETRLQAAAPQTSITGTDEVIPGDIPTKAALAGIDSLLRFQCESGFNRELQTTPEIRDHITPLRFK